MYQEDQYKEAKRRVKAKKEFYWNLFTWIVVSTFLFIMNAAVTQGPPWFLFPFLGWGMGVAFHAYDVFGKGGKHNKSWERQQIEKELRKIKAEENRIAKRLHDEDHDELDELELREIRKQQKNWDDQEFV